jgi:hypothetical protein
MLWNKRVQQTYGSVVNEVRLSQSGVIPVHLRLAGIADHKLVPGPLILQPPQQVLLHRVTAQVRNQFKVLLTSLLYQRKNLCIHASTSKAFPICMELCSCREGSRLLSYSLVLQFCSVSS